MRQDLLEMANFVSLGLTRRRRWVKSQPWKESSPQLDLKTRQANVCFLGSGDDGSGLVRLPVFRWGCCMADVGMEVAPKVRMDFEGLLNEVADLFHRVMPPHLVLGGTTMQLPKGVRGAMSDVNDNPVRVIQDYHVGMDELVTRFDVIYQGLDEAG